MYQIADDQLSETMDLLLLFSLSGIEWSCCSTIFIYAKLTQRNK